MQTMKNCHKKTGVPKIIQANEVWREGNPNDHCASIQYWHISIVKLFSDRARLHINKANFQAYTVLSFTLKHFPYQRLKYAIMSSRLRLCVWMYSSCVALHERRILILLTASGLFQRMILLMCNVHIHMTVARKTKTIVLEQQKSINIWHDDFLSIISVFLWFGRGRFQQ